MTPLQRIIARVMALGAAYFSVSVLERMAAHAEADAAAARLAAHAADAALYAHLTGEGCTCPEPEPAPDNSTAYREGYADAMKDAGRLMVKIADPENGGGEATR